MNKWPRTQKAAGLVSMMAGLKCGQWPARPSTQLTVAPSLEGGASLYTTDLLNLYMCKYSSQPRWKVKFPCFGRPCPTKPRHGFIESRTVVTVSKALDLLAETLRADPDGELILMPRFTGNYSGVATNAGVAWGYGNSGVTNGAMEGATYMIPAPLLGEKWRKMVCPPGSGVTGCPYIELVEDKGEAYMVQLRDGPAQDATRGNYTPRKMTVTGWISPTSVDNNLMRWDTVVRNSPPGTVAVLPEYMTRFSHFAVHCIVKTMPILFGDVAPVPGAVLEPPPDEPKPRFKKENYELIARVLMACFTVPQPILELGMNLRGAESVITSIGVCHAMPGWGTEAHLLRLRGEGIASCFRHSAAACLGEIRHFYSRGPGRKAGSTPTSAVHRILSAGEIIDFKRKTCIPRNSPYKRMSLLPLSTQINLLTQATTDFNMDGWGQAFGGESWATAAMQTAWLGRAIKAFCSKPNSRRWKRLQFRFNATLHACHNNGKVLTKWVPGMVLSAGGQAPTLCFMNAFAANIVLYPPPLEEFETLKATFEKDNDNV